MSGSNAQSLISIILPVYNGERYLAESVQSCLDQAYRNWELIIVDDASTDGTDGVVAGFAARDGRIRLLRHVENRNLPGSLNTGFANARGDLLTWTSDDNRFHPDALAEMAAVLELHPDVDYVYSDYNVIGADGEHLRTMRVAPPSQLAQMYDGVSCFLYRREVYERVGTYAEDLFLAEDYEFFLRVLAAGCSMYPLHKILYDYRVHARSLTDEQRGRTYAAAERALRRHLVDFEGASAELRGGLLLYLASLARWRGEYGRALGYLARSAQIAPSHVAHRLWAYLVKRLGRPPGDDLRITKSG